MRKVLLAVVVCVALSFASWVTLTGPYESKSDVSVITSNSQKTIIELSLPGVLIENIEVNGRIYNNLSLPVENGGILTEIGKPQIPILCRLVGIPPDCDVKLRITKVEYKTITDINLIPLQPPLPENLETQDFVIDQVCYQTNQFYPDNWAKLEEPAVIRDYRVVPLLIQPVRYNPVTNELQVATQLRLELIYEGISSISRKEIFRPAPSRAFEKIYRNFIINYDFLAPPQSPIDGTYLIIVPDNFYNHILPLAQWKRKKGWRTVVTRTSQIGTPLDSAKIYNYIHTAYTNWPYAPDYVLLVGDVEHVPCWHRVSSNATDHQYAKHEGSDYFADLMVGRISIKDTIELKYEVNKLVKYEKNPYMVQTDWYKKATTIGAYESGNPNRFWPTCIRCMNIMKTYAGFTEVDTLFQRWGLNRADSINSKLRQGRSWMLYRGHGEVTYWYNVSPYYDTLQVKAQANGEMQPVVIGPTCLTGSYDSPRCLSEYFVVAGAKDGATKGACGYFGSSRVSYSGYNDSLAVGTFLGYFRDTLNCFGQATNNGKMYMYRAYPGGTYTELEFEMFNNFGDPELNLWSAIPLNLTVSHPTAIPVGNYNFTVTVNGDKAPIKGAL
ncbi:MAG: C25 family cysteine peptidase, partial [candidate division WOR-3 bacterium]